MTKEGVLVDRGKSQDDVRPVFVMNFPLEFDPVDGREVDILALRTGTLQYEAVSGATKTVEMYDYGKPVEPKTAPALKTNAPPAQAPKITP